MNAFSRKHGSLHAEDVPVARIAAEVGSLATSTAAPLCARATAPTRAASARRRTWLLLGQGVQTCERHQGWLDVVHEWAERAKSAESAIAKKDAALQAGVEAVGEVIGPNQVALFAGCDLETGTLLYPHSRPAQVAQPLLFSKPKEIADRVGVPIDVSFNRIVREVEVALGIGKDQAS